MSISDFIKGKFIRTKLLFNVFVYVHWSYVSLAPLRHQCDKTANQKYHFHEFSVQKLTSNNGQQRYSPVESLQQVVLSGHWAVPEHFTEFSVTSSSSNAGILATQGMTSEVL